MELDRLTKETYQCPKGEELSYHCVIEIPSFDRNSGVKISRPRLQKFGRKTFEQVVYSRLLRQGYKVVVLHDPNDWLREKKAEIEALAAKKEAEAEAARKAEFEAAVEAEVRKRTTKAKKAPAQE